MYFASDVVAWNPACVHGPAAVAYREAMRQVVTIAKTTVPRRSGDLSRSVRVTYAGPWSAILIAGGTIQVDYARAQEYGAGPHDIPRGGVRKKLGSGGSTSAGIRGRTGRPDFGPVWGPVHHPGNPATGAITRAAAAFIPLFAELLLRKV